MATTAVNPMSHSRRLCSRIELALPAIQSINIAIVNHPRLKELFPEYLIRNHWLMRGSVPEMEAALRRCREISSSDPVAAALAPYYEEHIVEEQHHDLYLLEDLELIGFPRADVLRRLPSPAAVSAKGAILYWAIHHHPVAVLGALIPSECYPANMETLNWLQQQTGYPKAAFRTLELHSDLDQAHGKEALDMLDALPLDDWHHEVLGVASLHFLAGVTQMYRELLDDFPVE